MNIYSAPSPTFIDFLAKWLDESSFTDQRWADQRSESLKSNTEMNLAAEFRLQRLATSDRAHEAFARVSDWISVLCEFNTESLKALNRRFSFITVIGAPRTGGSYLTAALYRALGHVPENVPAALAHDGFPEGKPFSVGQVNNDWIRSITSMSEYLTMLEIYHSQHENGERIFVPKKMTKAVYAGGFFGTILGEDAEHYVTVRHPVSNCISTYEKSGGLPDDGKFRVRSAIEKWIQRDVAHVSGADVRLEGYFETFLQYWEQYYIRLALSGLMRSRRVHVIPYGKRNMEAAAGLINKRFNSSAPIDEFFVGEPGTERHPEWKTQADQAIERVNSVWSSFKLAFPKAEILECH